MIATLLGQEVSLWAGANLSYYLYFGHCSSRLLHQVQHLPEPVVSILVLDRDSIL